MLDKFSTDTTPKAPLLCFSAILCQLCKGQLSPTSAFLVGLPTCPTHLEPEPGVLGLTLLH